MRNKNGQTDESDELDMLLEQYMAQAPIPSAQLLSRTKAAAARQSQSQSIIWLRALVAISLVLNLLLFYIIPALLLTTGLGMWMKIGLILAYAVGLQLVALVLYVGRKQVLGWMKKLEVLV